MGQGTEACGDRPSEVSVIRFVSRNRTIEEIAPKKEVYTCKQRGCGKIFTNQEEYKTHEALEALKIRFICREPGCGEELSDPGSMWRHYQERHNNETNGFVCPYTNCGSLHSTTEILEDHIESCHRQPPTLPTEPEIICFEGIENSIDDDTNQTEEEFCYEMDAKNQQLSNENLITRSNGYSLSSSNNDYDTKIVEYTVEDEGSNRSENNTYQNDNINIIEEHKKITATCKSDEYNKETDFQSRKSMKNNETVSIFQEDFVIKYDSRSSQCNEILQSDDKDEKSNVLYINGDVTITKNLKIEVTNQQVQEHRIDLGNLEKVFRSGFEQDSPTLDTGSNTETNNCLDDEEYTPKKQRMSRYKQEPYKCDFNGCGKMYRYISHYRHHQDSHKLVGNSAVATKLAKALARPKQGKATTVSFFLCKMPGCGAQVNNVTSLWKHYHDNHANSKPSLVQTAKGTEIFRCKIPNCDMEFSTSSMMYKHFNDVHTSTGGSCNSSTNGKTANGSSIRFVDEMFQDDATAQQANFKTDFKAKYNVNIDEYVEPGNEQKSLPRIKEESRD
ncbi:uncharacterized protein [Venturia canescens]|uniref:uncharacterized protein n=1 Tax=Venturia canescens TaxID=32260 RepID=UPI001C9C736B|nr:uncharacterized protein LOC122406539 [Venturia canescens]